MRRVVFPVTVALGLAGILFGPVAAAAAPGTGGQGGQAPAPKKRCVIKDDRLRELSGLVATKTGYIVINDSTQVDSRKKIFFLNSKCGVSDTVSYSGKGPFDPEDLALSADRRTLWIADIGDNITNTEHRSRIALWSMPVNGSRKPVLHRLAYPEGKWHDAEALLMGDDGLPLIITKTLGKAEVFTPAAPLKTNNEDPVPMRKVGDVTLPKTSTENRLGAPGRLAVTGAARSPDGKRVVLRTYADAFEYDVEGGDIAKAITTGTPRATPLADPFGEAITYTPDGGTFLTVSDAGDLDSKVEIAILAYTPSKKPAEPVAADAAVQQGAGGSWFSRLSLTDITYLIAAVGVLGVILAVAGIFGIMRARKKPPAEGSTARGGAAAEGLNDHPGPGRSGYAGQRPENHPPSPPGGGGVYGGGTYGARPSGGGVYGGGRGREGGRPAGGVYGGGTGGGQGGSAGGGGYGRPAGGGGVYGGGGQRGGEGYPDQPGPRGGRDQPRPGRRGNGYGERGSYGEPRSARRGYPDSGYDYR